MENEKVDEKGLASRVEELENVLREAIASLAEVTAFYAAMGFAEKAQIATTFVNCERVLAGARAEEKE